MPAAEPWGCRPSIGAGKRQRQHERRTLVARLAGECGRCHADERRAARSKLCGDRTQAGQALGARVARCTRAARCTSTKVGPICVAGRLIRWAPLHPGHRERPGFRPPAEGRRLLAGAEDDAAEHCLSSSMPRKPFSSSPRSLRSRRGVPASAWRRWPIRAKSTTSILGAFVSCPTSPVCSAGRRTARKTCPGSVRQRAIDVRGSRWALARSVRFRGARKRSASERRGSGTAVRRSILASSRRSRWITVARKASRVR